jgi:CHAD domain-containing protein
MLPSGKWIDGIDADGSVEDVARRSMQARHTAVAHALPLAAYLADHDVEHVHRLRVATRRAIAALKLYRDGLPRKPARWLKRRLKKIRRAAGDARDLDVLAGRLQREYGERSAPVVQIIADRRADAQSAISDVTARCRQDDRFVRKTSKLLAGIEPRKNDAGAPERFRDWATARLADSAKAFFAGAPGDSSDTAALHQFRIRAKELRYTIELVVAALGPQLRDDYYPVVEELQERLGNVQDHVTAIAHLCEWADDAKNSERQIVLRDLAEDEREKLIDAVGDFQNWWTEERANWLRSGLARLTQTSDPTDCPQAVSQT